MAEHSAAPPPTGELAKSNQTDDANARLAAIVQWSDDAIVGKDLDGIITSWNRGAERLFGYTAEEAIGQPVTMLIPPERRDEEPGILARIRRGEPIEHYETIRRRKDGTLMDISLTVSPIIDREGNIIGASKIARDITERKRTEQALRDSDRRKNEFLATLAHELRNPLAPIRNSLHLLRMAGGDAATQRVHEMMERQVSHMVRLVDDLMEVARITTGKLDLRTEPVEVASFIRSAIETSRPLIEAGRHQLATSLPADPLTVDGDPMRLSQVVANVLNNSAKYTPPGGQIWLNVAREGGQVSISVRDTGIGIPADMLPRVFEMFAQGQRDYRPSGGGLGIGLALVKQLVEMHGGRVEAKSDGAGHGSEFTIRLPLARQQLSLVELQTQAERDQQAARQRILVVDDNQDAASSLGMLLTVLGSDVQIAYDGPSAIEALERHRPDVVLLDLGMPGMSGFEVARRLRQMPQFTDVTLVALTGWGQEDDRRRTREAGFDHHLVKPVNVDTLEVLLADARGREPKAK